MLKKLSLYFFLFIVYSIIGWILEEIYAYLTKKKIANRGFFIGPYCPIYGIGCLLIVWLLSSYKSHPAGMFVLAMLIASALEYFTSYIMEKLFKARWWDYSKTKYNINGRVCLDTMLPFGVISCVVIYVLHPLLMSIATNIPVNRLNILSAVLAVIFISDLIVSFNIVNNFKKTIKKASLEDRTEDINKYIRDVLSNKSLFYRRLLKAFPNGHAIIKRVNKKINKKD